MHIVGFVHKNIGLFNTSFSLCKKCNKCDGGAGGGGAAVAAAASIVH